MATKFKVKRSVISGVIPTTLDLDLGELAVNIADKKVYTSNGSSVFELSSNVSNISVTGNLTFGAGRFIANGGSGSAGQVLTSNGTSVYWSTATAQASVQISSIAPSSPPPNDGDLWWNSNTLTLYIYRNFQWVVAIANGGANTNVQFNDSSLLGGSNNFTYNKITGTLSVGNVTINSTSISTNNANIVLGNTSVIVANGSFGSNGQVLTSNGSGMYWGYGGGGPYVRLTSNTTLTPYRSFLADTTNGSVYLTLPASPSEGQRLAVADGGGNKITNPAIILRNGSTISGTTNDLSFDVPDTVAEFVYTGTTWKVFTW
jgi:hypothetical protein